jgi:penicillin-binding protein 1A
MTNQAKRITAVARPTSRPRQRRITTRSSFKKRFKTAFALLFLLIETAIAIFFVAFLAFFQRFSSDLPNLGTITDEVRPPLATEIFSQDGELLGTIKVENREPIALKDVPENVKNATVAIEDHRFYEHPGVDVQGIVRAAWVNMRGSRASQGASTLTQQLVRNLESITGVSREKNISRKAREILTAVRMEQFYSKQEILQLYLNNVYYGGGAYGIQAASKTYFGKPADKLDLSEAAMLAGLPQRPSSYTPFEHPKAAFKRRDEVLDALQKWNYITAAQCESAKAEQLKLQPPPKHKDLDFEAPYFVRYVLRDLIKQYGVDFVYSGIKIQTTLNWKMQQAAEKALKNGLQEHAEQGANQGAFVCLDPHNGYIRAMVGGRDFHDAQYNAVTQGRRQPGSTFKLFDYTALFDTQTKSLEDGYVDKPIPYPNDPKHRVVENYGGGTSGAWVSCKTGIQFSKNTIAVQAAQEIGIKKVIEYAHNMGITTELAPYLPTALGASAVHPLDLCSAYSMFPNGGSRYLPMGVIRIKLANGDDFEPHKFVPRTADFSLRPETVKQIDEALEAVVRAGTGTAARGSEENGVIENARGKTGTTNDNRDAWFAGYTPELTAVLWVASVKYKDGKPIYREMPGATGGHVCAPIWHDFMVKALPEQKKFNETYRPELVLEPGEPQTTHKTSNKPKKTNSTKTNQTPAPGTDLPPDVDTQDPNAPGMGHPDKGEDPAQANPGTSVSPDTTPPNQDHGTPTPAHETQNNGGLRSSTPSPSVPAPRPPDTGTPRTTPSRPLTVPKQPSADDEMVSVKVCVDSGDLAGRWCEGYKVKKMTRKEASKMHPCRQHKAPPGERG